jgi:hypothetical protein
VTIWPTPNVVAGTRHHLDDAGFGGDSDLEAIGDFGWSIAFIQRAAELRHKNG